MKTELILPDYVIEFMDVFGRSGWEIYVVGGAVRDLLLKRATDNWDFATNATPETIQELFSDSFYDNTYGTVTVPYNADDKKILFEVTPYRKEGVYTDSRHPDSVTWADTIEEDLSRRDFTINAMAYDGKNLVDPTNGLPDLEQKLIRAVGEPDKRFSEDALRLMRAVRFAAELGFFIEEATLSAVKEHAGLIAYVSAERIKNELFKILSSDHPAEGILFLKNTGLLHYILPEVDACFEIPQKSPGRHHVFDVGTHLVEALRHCPSSDPLVRFATLLHDIGKAETFRKDEETAVITFYNHEIVGAKRAKDIAERLRLSKKEREKLVTMVRYHMFTVSEEQTDKAVRRFIRQIGKENIDDMLALRVGDRLGSGARETSWRTELFKKRLEEVQNVPFSVTDLTIDGNDVIKELELKPGPRVGEILQTIFEEVDDGKLKNDRGVLLKRLSEFSK